jgi:hypothetical protein
VAEKLSFRWRESVPSEPAGTKGREAERTKLEEGFQREAALFKPMPGGGGQPSGPVAGWGKEAVLLLLFVPPPLSRDESLCMVNEAP